MLSDWNALSVHCKMFANLGKPKLFFIYDFPFIGTKLFIIFSYLINFVAHVIKSPFSFLILFIHMFSTFCLDQSCERFVNFITLCKEPTFGFCFIFSIVLVFYFISFFFSYLYYFFPSTFFGFNLLFFLLLFF